MPSSPAANRRTVSPEHWPTLAAVDAALRGAMERCEHRPFVLGLCGAQGSGKSTLSERLAAQHRKAGTNVAQLSIDDLYLTRAEREALAHEVHPLLRTRGVPGTHDTALGLATFRSMDERQSTPLPRFDKSIDDRAPFSRWDRADADTRILIFEGWCVGAHPQAGEALLAPVNALERDDDPEGVWRRFVNDRLAGDYQQLFGRLDFLVLLAAPSFDVVRAWRIEQEHELRASVGPGPHATMSDAEVGRFIQHYERLTRHILAEMPGRADLVLRLDEKRSLRTVETPC